MFITYESFSGQPNYKVFETLNAANHNILARADATGNEDFVWLDEDNNLDWANTDKSWFIEVFSGAEGIAEHLKYMEDDEATIAVVLMAEALKNFNLVEE